MELEMLNDYEAFIFELDDVLYPKKDYLLQVYYLFAQFIEYTAQIDAGEVIGFMKEIYRKEGAEAVFLKTADHFSLPEKYRYNFDLLHQTARLPLKLLMFTPVLNLMKQLVKEGKKLFLLADGDPEEQLNKIRQLEWNGLEQFIKVYFTNELANGSIPGAIGVIVNKYSLSRDKVIFFGNYEEMKEVVFINGVKLMVINNENKHPH